MPLHPDDAAAYWRSRIAPTDQFLVYVFDADGGSGTDPLAELRTRAAALRSLRRRIAPVPGDLGYPRWVPAPLDDRQFALDAAARTWPECLDLIGASMARPLDPRRYCWRVRVFDDVSGAPRLPGRARVVVVQVNHALGDGGRAAALARALLGGGEPVDAGERSAAGPAAVPGGAGSLLAGAGSLLCGAGSLLGGAVSLLAGAGALPLRAGLGLVRGIEASRVPGPPPGPAPIRRTALNRPAAPATTGGPVLRTLVLSRDDLTFGAKVPVTAGVLAVLAEALPTYLPALAAEDDGGLDSPGSPLVVETALARPRPRGAANAFLTVAVPLHPGEPDRERRARLIAAEIAAARERDASPRRVAERRAAAVTPAPLAALAVRLAAAAPPTDSVAGITLVSSVNRGPADLTLCGGRVVFTAGFPALSSSHRLTHGVHGLGETVTISLLADPAVVDADRYLTVLADAVGSWNGSGGAAV